METQKSRFEKQIQNPTPQKKCCCIISNLFHQMKQCQIILISVIIGPFFKNLVPKTKPVINSKVRILIKIFSNENKQSF